MSTWKWMGLLAALGTVIGCERLSLAPSDAPSPLMFTAAVAGMTIDWNAVEQPMTMGLDSTGSWCTVSLPPNEGDFVELAFHWHPDAWQTTEESLESALQPGSWSLGPGERPLAVVGWEGFSSASSITWNGFAISTDEDDLPVDLSIANVLEVVHGEEGCSASTSITWYPSSACQTDWYEEPFSIEHESGAVVLEAPEPGLWWWQIPGQVPIINTGELILAEQAQGYEVSMWPADPLGPLGDFMVTRQFPGNPAEDCSFEFECDWEVEDGAYLEVALISASGTVHSSRFACSSGPGTFQALEVTPFEADGEGRPTRLVQFSCDLLLESGGDAVQLNIEEGSIAFPVATE